jgi:hypothetical protein
MRSELTGRRFGRLTVRSLAGSSGKRTLWLCDCDCGGAATVKAYRLTRGETSSCGCLKTESATATGKANRAQDGRHEHRPTFRSWVAMKNRCYNPNHERYQEWGGRGIKVCDRWLGPDGFANFLADMGPRPIGRTLDREDNEKGYSAINCRWATPAEQASNRRPMRRARISYCASPGIRPIAQERTRRGNTYE